MFTYWPPSAVYTPLIVRPISPWTKKIRRANLIMAASPNLCPRKKTSNICSEIFRACQKSDSIIINIFLAFYCCKWCFEDKTVMNRKSQQYIKITLLTNSLSDTWYSELLQLHKSIIYSKDPIRMEIILIAQSSLWECLSSINTLFYFYMKIFFLKKIKHKLGKDKSLYFLNQLIPFMDTAGAIAALNSILPFSIKIFCCQFYYTFNISNFFRLQLCFVSDVYEKLWRTETLNCQWA